MYRYKETYTSQVTAFKPLRSKINIDISELTCQVKICCRSSRL